MSTGKRFEIRGSDEHGDVHIVGTDEKELAHEMMSAMEEDLQEVTLTDNDDMPDDLKKARELREGAARPENAGNLAAMMILMAEELVEQVRNQAPQSTKTGYLEAGAHFKVKD